jgi:hypothetical protein
MWKRVLLLIGLSCAFSVSALTNQELMNNLSSRLNELPEGRGTLIKSFTGLKQSYIYDQALAVIAFTKENEQAKARKLLSAMKNLQLTDGSLYFSYYLDGSSPYPQEGDKRIAGAIAWVALAATHYQHKFKSREFLSFNYLLLTYLHSQIAPIKIKGVENRALVFAPNDVQNTPFLENDTVALEHNLDAYAAFYHFIKINKVTKWQPEVNDLKKFIMAMWDKDKSHFWSGAAIRTGAINKNELYLDNQTWSLLALDKATLKEIEPASALKINCEEFYVKHEGISGFHDSKPTKYPGQHEFVWSEGTLGQVLAMKEQNVTCNDLTSQHFLTEIKKMKKEDGGIAYATSTAKQDFTTSSSVAGTAWLYFASNDFNPFHVEGLN